MLELLKSYHRLAGAGWARRDDGRVFRSSLLVLAIPVLLLLAVASLATAPPQVPQEAAPGALAAAEVRAQARAILDSAPAVSPEDPAAAARAIADIATLRAALTQDSATRSDSVHRVYRAEVILIAAGAIVLVLSMWAVVAQVHLIRGHTSRHRPDAVSPGRWLLSGGVCLGLALTAVALAPEGLPLPLPDPSAWWIGAVVVAVLTVAALLVHLSAFGARLVAANFPAIIPLAVVVRDMRKALHAPVTEEATRLDAVVSASDPIGPDELLAAAVAVWPDPAPQDAEPPVDTRMSPKSLTVMLNAMGLVLSVVLVSSLVVVALALDAAEAHAALSGRLANGAAASADTWVLALGAGFSLMLAAVLLPPAAHLAPFVSAAEDIPSPSSPGGWTVSGGLDLAGAASAGLEIAPRKRKPEDPLPATMECYLGADRGKFLIVLTAAHYGGGFHTILSDTLKNRLSKVLGLLAPALAGSVLSVLG